MDDRFKKSFKKAVEEAIEGQIGTVEDALYAAAVGGNVIAQKYFLGNRAPKKWKDTTRHEIGGSAKIEFTFAELIKAKKKQEE